MVLYRQVYEYNLEDLRKRKADPEFKAEESAYLDAYHPGKRKTKANF